MGDEASNILRRLIRVSAQLDPERYGYLQKSLRTLDVGDLRKLAEDVRSDRGRRFVMGRHPHPATEIRGLAKAIDGYGGPAAVRRDADPALVEAVNRMGWQM